MLRCRHETCSEPATSFSVYCKAHHSDQLHQFGITLPGPYACIEKNLGLLARGIITRTEFIRFTVDSLAENEDLNLAAVRELRVKLPAELSAALLGRLSELKATGYRWQRIAIGTGPPDPTPWEVYAERLANAHRLLAGTCE